MLSPSEQKAPASNPSAFFAKGQIPTLEEIASLAYLEQLISPEQLGSIERVEDHLTNQVVGPYKCALSIISKLKKLHRYVTENNLEKVDQLLNDAPPYLLPFLLKTPCVSQTSAKGMKNYVVVEGSALRKALGAQAFGRNGCDLCLFPSDSKFENTTPKKLVLFCDDEADSPFQYMVDDTVIRIDPADFELENYFDELKEMFKNFSKQILNFDHPALTETQQDAYAALLKITKTRKHTLSVNQEGMVELLKRHIRRAFPTDGESIIATQTLEQFTEESEQREEKEYISDSKMLQQIKRAIKNASSPQDEKLITAFDEFIKHFEPKAGEILKVGRYGKNWILFDALQIGYNSYREFSPNNNNNFDKTSLWFINVIGWLQRLVQDHIKQIMAQGFLSISMRNKKAIHSLIFQKGAGSFLLPDMPGTGVGFDSWINLHIGRSDKKIESVSNQEHYYFGSLCKYLNEEVKKSCDEAKLKLTPTPAMSSSP